MEICQLLETQRAYFRSGATLSLGYRAEKLRKLHSVIASRQQEIGLALREDLGKSDFEGYMCETGMVLEELRYMLRHMRGFARERTVHTPLAQFAARSYGKPSPYGTVLIMSPWNYPFLLTMGPLTDAIAAGNTAVVKPSAYAPATGKLIKSILEQVFSPEQVAVVTGGRQENKDLLSQKFDLVFFTGSQNVGKEVLRHTAETLTPAVLELGGKSPCIVDETAKIPLAARRIVFGKFLNCGQTCVAPDYILCNIQVKDALVQALKREITAQYGEDPLKNPDYGKIINKKHFERLTGLLDPKKIVIGGRLEEQTLRIAPTVMDGVTWQDPVMGQEIFGPILPILTFERIEEVCTLLQEKPKPLALYLFSEDKKTVRYVMERCAFGGGCVNDTVIHLATPHMGFGGVGESGMGAYHGKTGFDTFSHRKSIVAKKTWMDLPIRYSPYKRGMYEKLLHMFMK